MQEGTVLLLGGGEMATGVASYLFHAGYPVIISELEKPLMIRRKVSFGECVYTKQHRVEGITAKKAAGNWKEILEEGCIPVVTDLAVIPKKPFALIDATLRKTPSKLNIEDARIVIGLGPGFLAKKQVHAVIETNRGHNLGRIYYEGRAEEDTKTPGAILGYTLERVLRAPVTGVLVPKKEIGDRVYEGECIAMMEGYSVCAKIDGVLRGILHEGVWVKEGTKIADVDPRGVSSYAYTISDKARTIAGSVLQALLVLSR